MNGSSIRPTDPGKAQTTWDTKDQLAFSVIALRIKPSEQEHVYDCTTSKKAWDTLKEVYSGTGMH